MHICIKLRALQEKCVQVHVNKTAHFDFNLEKFKQGCSLSFSQCTWPTAHNSIQQPLQQQIFLANNFTIPFQLDLSKICTNFSARLFPPQNCKHKICESCGVQSFVSGGAAECSQVQTSEVWLQSGCSLPAVRAQQTCSLDTSLLTCIHSNTFTSFTLSPLLSLSMSNSLFSLSLSLLMSFSQPSPIFTLRDTRQKRQNK